MRFHTQDTCRTSELQFELSNQKSNLPSYFPHNHTQQKTNIKSSLPSYFPTSTQQNTECVTKSLRKLEYNLQYLLSFSLHKKTFIKMQSCATRTYRLQIAHSNTACIFLILRSANLTLFPTYGNTWIFASKKSAGQSLLSSPLCREDYTNQLFEVTAAQLFDIFTMSVYKSHSIALRINIILTSHKPMNTILQDPLQRKSSRKLELPSTTKGLSTKGCICRTPYQTVLQGKNQDRRNILPVSSPFEKQQWQSVSSTLQSKIQKAEQTKLETKDTSNK